MPRFLILLMILPLAACMGGARQQISVASYELTISAAAIRPAAINLRNMEVSAPSWLGSNRMQYRLAYSDPARRRDFAESRWVAPPAEMLAQSLRKTLVAGAGGCRLRLELDEFVQIFDAAEESHGWIEIRATLLPSQDEAVLARGAFKQNRRAVSADARGGVAALNEAATKLSNDLRVWLDSAAGVAAACGGK